jgi:hypothetical protein
MVSVYCPSCKTINLTPHPSILKLLHIFSSDVKPYYCNALKCNTYNRESIRKKLEKNINNYKSKRDSMFDKCYISKSLDLSVYNNNVSYPDRSSYTNFQMYHEPMSFLEHSIKKSNFLYNTKAYPKNEFRHTVALYMNTVLDELNYYSTSKQPLYDTAVKYVQFHIAQWIETNIQKVLECIKSIRICVDVEKIILEYL